LNHEIHESHEKFQALEKMGAKAPMLGKY